MGQGDYIRQISIKDSFAIKVDKNEHKSLESG